MSIKYRNMLKSCLSILLIACLVFIGGCDSATPPESHNTAEYLLDGVLIKNLSNNQISVVANVEKDNLAYGDVDFMFGSDTLIFNDSSAVVDSIYTFENNNANSYPSGQIQLSIDDSTFAVTRLSVNVPDTFSITSIVPTNGQWRPTDGVVSLNWSGSDLAESYVIAIFNSNDNSQRYSEYAGELATTGNIPIDIFYTGISVDTGLYYFYVYALSGTPDKSLADLYLPVDLPEQSENNISENDIYGHFGTVVISDFDTLRVITQ